MESEQFKGCLMPLIPIIGIAGLVTSLIFPSGKLEERVATAIHTPTPIVYVAPTLEPSQDMTQTSCPVYPPPELYNKSKEYVQLLIGNPRLRAMLNLIADYEGKGSSSQSYCTTVSGVQFTDNTHPGEDAGRYNIPIRVWYGSASELGFTTFGPLEQDLVGVFLIDQKMGALNLVLSENDNDLRAAITLLAYQWKGLPKEENQKGIEQAIADFNNKYYPEALAGQEIIFKNTQPLRIVNPIATPQPTSSYYPVMNYDEIYNLLLEIGFPPETLDTWTNIILWESSGNPMAIGDDGNARGPGQINIIYHPEYKEWDLFDPRTNLKAVYEISGGGCFTGAFHAATTRGVPDKICNR